jgi:hypothetical protein
VWKDLGSFLFLVSGTVSAIAVIATGLWFVIRAPLRDFIEKVTQTNETLTVNGNKDPDNRTILDRLGNVEAEALEAKLYRHEMGQQVDRLEGKVDALGEAATADAGRLEAHEEWSARTATRLGVPPMGQE